MACNVFYFCSHGKVDHPGEEPANPSVRLGVWRRIGHRLEAFASQRLKRDLRSRDLGGDGRALLRFGATSSDHVTKYRVGRDNGKCLILAQSN